MIVYGRGDYLLVRLDPKRGSLYALTLVEGEICVVEASNNVLLNCVRQTELFWVTDKNFCLFYFCARAIPNSILLCN